MADTNKKLPMRRLFLDIETSPNLVWSWNIGSRIRLTDENIKAERQIICAAWKWEGKEAIQYEHWGGGHNDERILRRVIPDLWKADEVVAHNGDSFDLRWLRTRALKFGFRFPYHVVSFDTLKAARRQFRLNSNKLDYIARYLGLKQKTKVEYQLWKDVLSNVPGSLSRMIQYCQDDILVLEGVFEAIRGFCPPATHHGATSHGPTYGCPNCGKLGQESLGSYSTPTGQIKHKRACSSCNQQFVLTSTKLQAWQQYSTAIDLVAAAASKRP